MISLVSESFLEIDLSDKEKYKLTFHLCVDKASFTNVTKWIDDAKSIRGNDLLIILVGNKID